MTTKADQLLALVREFQEIDGVQIPDEILRGMWTVAKAPAGTPLTGAATLGRFSRDSYDTLFFDVDATGRRGYLLDDIKGAELKGTNFQVKTGRGLFQFTRA